MTKEEFFLIKKSEIEMLDTIGAMPHNALISVLKDRPCSEHNAAIAQAARDDERKKVLDEIAIYLDTCNWQKWCTEYMGIKNPKCPCEWREPPKKHKMLKKIESLRSSNPAAPTTKAELGPEKFPNSAELITMAKTEWQNRMARNASQTGYKESCWCNGWMTGYLSPRPLTNTEQRIADTITELERRAKQAEVVGGRGLYILGLTEAISLLKGKVNKG